MTRAHARTLLSLACTALLLGGCSVMPGNKGGGSSAQGPHSAPPQRSAAAAQCLSGLGSTGASFAVLPDQFIGGGCTNLNTVQLAALTTDSTQLQLGNIGPVTCDVSQAFAGWARFGADRAAQQILGTPLKRIETFGSYSCRNVAGTNRRSAHSTGEAIDISGFVLADGRRITVKAGWKGGTAQEREFLRVVEQSACKRFATVLGPEYNTAHEDHFHVEGVGNGRSFCR